LFGKAALTLSHGNAVHERGFFHQQCFVDKGERIIVGKKHCSSQSGEGSHLHLWRMYRHPEYTVFLENECKQALLEEKEREKSEQAKEA